MLGSLYRCLSIALSGLILAACVGSTSLAAESPGAAPRPIANASLPAVTRTPSGIFISTVVRPADNPASPTKTATPLFTNVIVQGRVYDAGAGMKRRLQHATIEWQFTASDWQAYNGQLSVPDDGLYRLQLTVRPEDEVLITARAPGYSPTTARLFGRQLNIYGTRLNFGLVNGGGPVPTVPGSLGAVQLRGIVYNLARGLIDPIGDAHVTIVNQSVVQPETQIDVTTSASGVFTVPLTLHTTDQIECTITATGYLTGTLSKSAQDLAKNPQLSIGLRPAPEQ